MKSRRKNYFKYFNLFFAIAVLVFIAGCTGAPPTVPIINSFLALSPNIVVGESSTLSWSVTDATTVTIDHGVGTVDLSGTNPVNPIVTTTYTLTATNTAGIVTASVTVTVGAAYGAIDIVSDPVGAKVYLDGVYTGLVTPTVLNDIEVGIHTIKLDKFHYKIEEDDNVSVTGMTNYLHWSLTYAPPEILTLQPGSEGKDADVDDSFPNANSGSYNALWIGYSNTFAKYRTYLQFDLNPTPLPAGAVVINAYLKLHQYDFGGSGSFTVGLHKVTSGWEENFITWNNQPTSSSNAESFCAINKTFDWWREWDVSELVRGWLDSSVSNYGMLLKPTDEPANDKVGLFRSSDYITDTTKCPKLEIYYYIP